MINRSLRLFSLLGLNAVPAAGIFLGGWSSATALALYWWENFFGALLIGIRIALHRKLTRKRGHYESRITTRTKTVAGRRVTTKTIGEGSYLVGFLVAMLVFTGAHGIFLAAILLLVLPQQLGSAGTMNVAELKEGWLAMSGFLLVGLGIDLIGLRQRPFAWLKQIDMALGRMVVVHLTIIFGMFAMATLDQPRAFFAVFIGLKTLVNLGSWVPNRDKPVADEPPNWILWIIRRFGAEADFKKHWRKDRETERQAEMEAEMTLDEQSTRAGHSSSR